MIVKFFTFEAFHNKKDVGSTRLRVHNLIKYWDEAGIYKYGEKPDVLIFQKVYTTQDYDFPIAYDGGIKILDICDPDWLEGAPIKQTVDAVDAVVTPTQPLAEFIKQLTDKPVRVIKDRFDLEKTPKVPKIHTGKAKKAVWFGYAHNAELLKFAVRPLEELGFKFIIISNENPGVERWGNDVKNYTYYKFSQPLLYDRLQEADICLMPIGNRPKDRFKSENRSVQAWLCGIPTVSNLEELELVIDAEGRNKVAKERFSYARKHYDCIISVDQYKELIKELGGHDRKSV